MLPCVVLVDVADKSVILMRSQENNETREDDLPPEPQLVSATNERISFGHLNFYIDFIL